MTLNDYIRNLQRLAEEHGDSHVIYASDDEGNDFRYVHYHACTGWYDYKSREFTNYIDNREGYEFVVCLN